MIRVWAPKAGNVTLVLDDDDVPLSAGAGGWWEDTRERPAGTRYWLRVDGGPPRPDPRAASQPDGVDGPSVVVDHRAFPWTDAAWTGPVPLPAGRWFPDSRTGVQVPGREAR